MQEGLHGVLAIAVRGKLPGSKVIPYWIAQLVNAFIAALILFFIYQGALVNYEAMASGAVDVKGEAVREQPGAGG